MGYRSTLQVKGGPPICPFCQAYKDDGEPVELTSLERRIVLGLGPRLFREYPLKLYWDLFLCNRCGRFVITQDPPANPPVKVPGGWISGPGDFKESNFNISHRSTLSDPEG